MDGLLYILCCCSLNLTVHLCLSLSHWPLLLEGQMDRLTDWWTDGWTNGRTGRQTDGRMDGQTDGRTYGQIDGCTDEQMDGRTTLHTVLLLEQNFEFDSAPLFRHGCCNGCCNHFSLTTTSCQQKVNKSCTSVVCWDNKGCCDGCYYHIFIDHYFLSAQGQ